MARTEEEIDRIEANRRQLASRNTRLAQRSAEWLAKRNVSPNTISVAGLVFGTIAGAALYLLHWPLPIAARIALLVLAIVGIQSRLACNLLDGMVAMLSKRTTRFGEIFNDLPDRLADWTILLGAGYATRAIHGVALGWLAAMLAVMTAYIRVLGRSCGTPMRYLGPMAKQHRMATLTIACAIAIVASFWDREGLILEIALWIIVIGCIITLARRLFRLKSDLTEIRP